MILDCLECPETFTSYTSFKRHQKCHMTGKWHICYMCNRSFATVEELTTHKATHPKKVFPCDICGKNLNGKNSYDIHRRRHLQDYAVRCEECDIGFITKKEYRLHMGTRHGQTLFICEVCGKCIQDNASLQIHMRTHDKDYRQNAPYRCDICNKTYLQEEYLKLHYRRTHKSENLTFVCDICGKILKTKQNLKHHKLMHDEGNKNNQCVECGKSFFRKDTLIQHMRVHTGQRPYECIICGKSFTQKTPLTVHMRTHTGEKPYDCPMCDMKFPTKTGLNSHVEKTHI